MALDLKIIQAEIAAVAGIATDACWHPMGGGRSNHVWRIGADLVCKLYRPDNNPLFRNSGADEFAALAALAGQGIAPDPIGYHEFGFGEVVLYRHISGEIWQGDVGPVAEILHTLHQRPVPMGLEAAPRTAEEIVQSGRNILGRLGEREQSAMSRLLPDVPDIGLGQDVFLHGDVVPANVIEGASGVRLIDWQSPKTGDAVFDAAYFLSPAMQIVNGRAPMDHSDMVWFWQAYNAPEVEARYHDLAPLLHWRMACYCAWRVASGDLDYQSAQNEELSRI